MKSLLGKPLFEICWFYMGIAQIALDPPSPLCQTGKCGKKCSKPSWQALTPPTTTTTNTITTATNTRRKTVFIYNFL